MAKRAPKNRSNRQGSVYPVPGRGFAATITLDDGRRKTAYCKTETLAKAKLVQLLAAQQKGQAFPNERLTVGAWLDQWFVSIQANCEPTTVAKYSIMINKHIRPYIGSIALARLSLADVKAWQTKLAAAGASGETQRSALTRLRTALEVAFTEERVTRNVASMVERPKVAKPKHQPPNVDSLRHLLDTIAEDRRRALAYVVLGCSLRRAEVLGLHWEDIRLEARTLTVNRRVNRVGRGVGLIVRSGAKSDAGVRTVALPQIVVDALRAQRKFQLEDRMAAGDKWLGADYANGPTGFVFTGALGTVMEPRVVDRWFATVRERAGQTERKFHGLRHDFAGLLLVNGTPTAVISQMMGHSSYSVTANLYTHVPAELQRVAANSLDGLLAPAVAI